MSRDICFNELAHEYETWLKSPIGSTYDSLAKKAVFSQIDIKEGDHILEVGSGTGNYALELAEMGAKVVGVEASKGMIQISKRNAVEKGLHIDFKHAFGEDLQVPDETFDLILSMNMLEFSPDPEKVVSEIFRVLKNGGQLVIGVLNKNSLWGFTKKIKKIFVNGAYYESSFFSSKELINLLSAEQLGVMNISTTIYFPPLNQKHVIKLSKAFEKVGQRMFPLHGALIVVKAKKEI